MFAIFDLGHWFRVSKNRLKWDMYRIRFLKKYRLLLERPQLFLQPDRPYPKRMQNLIESKILKKKPIMNDICIHFDKLLL